jgi:HSP20 family protein
MASNVTNFDPFRDFAAAVPLRTLGDFFREFEPGTALRDTQAGPTIGIDVTENDQAYIVRAQMPGVNKDDIKVDIHGNHVSITAESRRVNEQKDAGRVLRSEIYYGQMHRSFTLEHEIDESKAEAKYVDGVLELTLPKKAGTGGRQLQIH